MAIKLDSIGKQASVHVLAALSGRVLNFVALGVSSLVLARLLEQEDFVNYSIAINLLSFFAIISSCSIGNVALRALSNGSISYDRQNQIVAILRKICIYTSVFGFLFSVFCCVFFCGGLFSQPFTFRLILFFSLNVVLRGLLSTYAEVARAKHLPITANLVAGVSGGGLLNAAILLVLLVVDQLFPLDWHSCIFINLVATIAILPVLRILTSWEKRSLVSSNFVGNEGLDIRGHELDPARLEVEMLKSGIYMTLVACVIFASDQADIFIPAWGSSADEASGYVAARRISILVALLPVTINMGLGGVVSSLHTNGSTVELTKIMRLSTAVASIPTILLGLVLFFFLLSV